MSTSVSKTGNTSYQRSCTVVPSPPSKGGCVSCPPDTICCLFMVLSTSAKHVVTCLRCVSFCVRNDIQPFEKCPFCCSPGSQLPVLPLQRTEAAALTAPQASRSWAVAADQIAQKALPPAAWCTALGLSSALSSSLSGDPPAQVACVLCGTIGPLVVRPPPSFGAVAASWH